MDFTECDKFACHNLLKTVCEYKKEHPELFVNDIADQLHLNQNAVRKWLKRGSKLGLCDYDSSKEIELCKQDVVAGFKSCLQDFYDFSTKKGRKIDECFYGIYDKYVKGETNG